MKPRIAIVTFLACSLLVASSHREAPSVKDDPLTDATDFYMFRSYEPDRQGFVTLIANYGSQQPGGPPQLPTNRMIVIDVHISNNLDPVEDLTFRFTFQRAPNQINTKLS